MYFIYTYYCESASVNAERRTKNIIEPRSNTLRAGKPWQRRGLVSRAAFVVYAGDVSCLADSEFDDLVPHHAAIFLVINNRQNSAAQHDRSDRDQCGGACLAPYPKHCTPPPIERERTEEAHYVKLNNIAEQTVIMLFCNRFFGK